MYKVSNESRNYYSKPYQNIQYLGGIENNQRYSLRY